MRIFIRQLILFVLTAAGGVYAQTGQSPVKEIALSNPKGLLQKGITLSGMFSGNHVYYSAAGISNRTVPFNVLYTGNLSVNLFGKLSLPVSFSVSNQSFQFSHPLDQAYRFRQPINRFLLKPTYKGFTLQLGTCALQFSPYTLAGHRYNGIGLEYKNPKKPFYGSLMAGYLQGAVRMDTTFQTFNNRPSYQRIGLGVMAGYRKNEDRAEVIFFTAADRLSSLPYTLDAQNILPQQNAVVSLKGAKSFLKKIVINAEMAFSGITNDLRAPETTLKTTLFNTFFGFFTPKTSTDFRKAFKTEVLYRNKTFNTGLQYSRVDPNYRTLGAYFFVNDMETLEAKAATQLLSGKLTLSGNLGIQRDNVSKQKLKTNQRTVGALNIQFTPTSKINLLINYSSFTNYSNILPAYDYLTRITPYSALDTLNFRQINQNLMIVAGFQLPAASKDVSQSVTFNGIFQQGSDRQGSVDTQNNLTNVSLDYNLSHSVQKMAMTASLNYSRSFFNGLPTRQWGPAITFSKGLNTKWRANVSGLYTLGKTFGSEAVAANDRTLNARLGLTGQLTPKANLLLNVIYFDRSAHSLTRSTLSFHELTATVGFSYQFNAALWKKNP